MAQTVGEIDSYPLVTKPASASLDDALATMFDHGYTQLGVEHDGTLVGMVSYRSVSRVLTILGQLGVERELDKWSIEFATEELEPVVAPDRRVSILFDLLAETPYVLVGDPNRDDPGPDDVEILTDYDLLHSLRDRIEPFLLVEAIERAIRELIRRAFADDDEHEVLTAVFADSDLRTPQSVADCSFGHYATLITTRWATFQPFFEESSAKFPRQLIDEVGAVRNTVVHFRPTDQERLDRELLQFAREYFQARVTDPEAVDG